MDEPTAILLGGPQDQALIPLDAETVLHEVPDNGTVHRYIRTTAHRAHEGRDLVVFHYDGQTYDGQIYPTQQG